MRLTQLALEAVDRLGDCRDRSTFESRLNEIASRFGFERTVIFGTPKPGESLKPGVLVSNYPSDWTGRYHERGYADDDPVVNHLRKATMPVLWSALRPEPKSRSWLVMAEAADAHLVEGFAIPVVAGHGQRAQVVFAGSNTDIEKESLAALHLIGLFAHNSLQGLVNEEIGRSLAIRPHLTPREIECLQWAAAGKSYWETGQIMAISARTVKHHLRSAAAKMGVYGPTPQAVAQAMRLSLIN